MAGNKTHEQNLRIIEKRENTKNADKDFDADKDLRKTEAERAASRQDNLRSDVRDIADRDDRNIIRGENQESSHNKHRTDR
ncbi:hypothetical protein NKJ26_08735 [Mesorhizobium sp. M0152]|uniref:hypothetical protein n=1 Tax=unclassified Mesorhizobium TaxID=325217 RepID=UPI00333ABC95